MKQTECFGCTHRLAGLLGSKFYCQKYDTWLAARGKDLASSVRIEVCLRNKGKELLEVRHAKEASA